MFSSSSTKFDTLPARPPTPPREISKAVDDAISFLDDCNEVDRLLNKPQAAQERVDSTNQLSPPSSRVLESSSDTSRKVDFSPYPTYYEILRPGQLKSPNATLIKASPLSREAKPLRSILKPAEALSPLTPEDLNSRLISYSPQLPGSFAKMLQSVIQQLASTSRSLRLDAYLALNGVLKTYEGVPDVAALKQRIDFITQFLTRDMAWKNSEGHLDANIITQAVTLTTALLFDTRLAESLDDDFKTFVVDRSIAVLDQPNMPKSIVKAHLYVLAQQRFRAHIITPTKAEKILSALQTIEDRCSGNNIVASRLVIYQRLFEQAPNVMLTRIRDWLEHVFHGMLSSVKEVRTRALETCRRAGLVFGVQPHAGKAVQDLFETEVEEGQTYFDYLTLRLGEMIDDKEVGGCVPQFWSSIVLFFRSKRMPLEKWSNFKMWLRIIQRCLNSSDITIRYQATLAWNTLVFAIMPDASTTRNMMSMLRIPISSGLEKRGADKYSQQVRHYALDSYYNLLHYALRPGLSNEEYDYAWDTFVEPMLANLTRFDGKGRYNICRVLHGLVNGNVGVWDANVALDQPAVKPEQLPKLEPRWIRSRLERFLSLLKPTITTSMRSSPEESMAIDAIWHGVMRSITNAGCQEVRTSNDLKQAIALLLNLLHGLWTGYSSPTPSKDGSRWLERYVSLIVKMVAGLGAGPFVEDILLTTKDNVIEVAPTPSQKHSKQLGSVVSPLRIILEQFYCPPDDFVIDEGYQEAAYTVLNRLTSSAPTFHSRLELLSRNVDLLGHAPDQTSRPLVREHVWIAITRNTLSILASITSSRDVQDSQSLGHSFRHALDILGAGLQMTAGSKTYSLIDELYIAIYGSVKALAGEGGIVLALMEPLAKVLKDARATATLSLRLHITSSMLQKAVWPRNRQSLEQARKALWGVSFAPQNTAVLSPFDHLYELVVELAVRAYTKLDELNGLEVNRVHRFFTSVVDFLEKCPPAFLGHALRKVQEGLAIWIEDNSKKTGGEDGYSSVVQNAWSRIIQLFQKIPKSDSAMLSAFESLLVAGFLSPHRSIINSTIVFWNESFGNELVLEYPHRLEQVLRARALDADIILPTFPDSSESSISLILPDFYESQSQLPTQRTPAKTLKDIQHDVDLVSASQPVPRSPYLALPKSPLEHRLTMSSPASKPLRRSASTTPKPRLRHDNSQIQFAPIDSSPLPTENESQVLTEHQKEVKARQYNDAQLFPEFSSSPIAKSTALPKLSKRLTFTLNIGQNNDDIAAPGTPSGLPDTTGLMSDDLPSSPTPSSMKTAMPEPGHDRESEIPEQDPPSSPPRAGEDAEHHPDEVDRMESTIAPQEMTVDIVDFGAAPMDAPAFNNQLQIASQDHADEEESEGKCHDSDLPSDTQLPSLQLHQEAEAALDAPDSTSNPASGDRSIAFLQDHRDNVEYSEQNVVDAKQPSETKQEPASDAGLDITRIEDSFVKETTADNEVDVQSTHNSQGSQRTGRKRKRAKSTGYVAKKRKQPSPFTPFTRHAGDRNEHESDEDIGEEIVVASSQRSSSPLHNMAQVIEASTQVSTNIVSKASEISEQGEIAPNGLDAPPKRGPGRPRKSVTPKARQTDTRPSRTLKRKASALSNADTVDSEVTPKSVKATRTEGEDHPTMSPAVVVIVESTKRTTIDAHQPEEECEETEVERSNQEDTSTQLSKQQATVQPSDRTPERPIATPRSPRSMLKRLRDALNDFKGIILGSQEERQFDEVLFELRRETHEAGRRGREREI